MAETALSEKKCKPCEGGIPPLDKGQSQVLLKQLRGWQLEEKKIAKQYQFKDFKRAMRFVNAVAEMAESEGHHPDIFIQYDKVKLTLWTHAAGGLTENDFILAAKVDSLPIKS